MAELLDYLYQFGIKTLRTKIDENEILESMSDLDLIQDRNIYIQSFFLQVGNLYLDPTDEMLDGVPLDKIPKLKKLLRSVFFSYLGRQNRFSFKFNPFRLVGSGGKINPIEYEDVFEYLDKAWSLQVYFQTDQELKKSFQDIIVWKVSQLTEEINVINEMNEKFPNYIDKLLKSK